MKVIVLRGVRLVVQEPERLENVVIADRISRSISGCTWYIGSTAEPLCSERAYANSMWTCYLPSSYSRLPFEW